MKKITLVLVLLLGLTFSVNAQKIMLSKPELSKKLCKNWLMESAVINGKVTKVPAGKVQTMQFKTDNTYVTGGTNAKSNGNWSYDPKSKYVKISVGKETGEMHIISITDTEFISKIYIPNGPAELNSMEMHFKVKK